MCVKHCSRSEDRAATEISLGPCPPRTYTLGFLSLSSMDVLCWIMSFGGLSCALLDFCSIPDLHPLDTRNTILTLKLWQPKLSRDTAKCPPVRFREWKSRCWKAKSSPLRTTDLVGNINYTWVLGVQNGQFSIVSKNVGST